MRLTKEMRNEMINAVLEHRFGSAKQALLDREHDLAESVLFEALGRERYDLLTSVPKGWLGTLGYLNFVLESGENHTLHFAETKPLPYYIWHGSSDDGDYLVVKGNMAARVQKLMDDYDAHEDARRKARDQVRAAVYSYTTVERLLEEWPEIAPFVPRYAKAPQHLVPAPMISTLNMVLGLPVEEA
jgi:hypothetical protein